MAKAKKGSIDTKELDRADALLEKNEFATAAAIAEQALLPAMEDFVSLSRAATIKGKALVGPMVPQLIDGEKENPPQERMREPHFLFSLASALDPDNDEAEKHVEIMEEALRNVKKAPEKSNHPAPFDVVIVGAGASGVGLAILMTKVFGMDSERVLLVERGEGPGETFKQWPKEMRFISPSFNSQGWTNSFDLNSIAYGTSPAFTMFSEHLTGQQYADYLKHVANANELNIRANTEVKALRTLDPEAGFEVDVLAAGNKLETLRSRYVVWAAGEFQYQREPSKEIFPGSELCVYNSSIRSWADMKGDDHIIIGGYESGMDAASNLSLSGKKCTVLSSTAYWNHASDDPSTELAPYTAHRVREACASSFPPRLLAPLRVFAVEKEASGGYVVHARVPDKKDEEEPEGSEAPLGEHRTPLQVVADELPTVDSSGKVSLRTMEPPILCVGFKGSVALGLVKDLFQFGKEDPADDDNDGDVKEKEKEEDGDRYKKLPRKYTKDDVTREVKESVQGKNAGSGGSGCDDGSPLLNQFDESTITPGLFLAGPAVRHDELSFCFVYKFRQRFGIVAEAIARGLGFNTEGAIEECREMNMFLDDFSCCKGACGETC